MHWFLGDDFVALKNIFEILSYIATMVGVYGVFYAIKSFKKSEEDSRQTEQSKLMENSIEVLRVFSTNIIPQIEKFESEVEETYQNLIASIKEQVLKEDGKDLDEQNLPEELVSVLKLQAKAASGGYRLMNQLEQVCAFIKYDLIIPDVVYPTIHSVFLRFLKRNEDLLKKVTSDHAPYNNIYGVRDKWSEISAKEELDREQRELDLKRANLNKTAK
ncbi:hypothetical protein [Lactococcus taiwanensis]|uniref:hypothetical protein n=1 Tax=Lactococcus taiwanensis TaxID=1151742 RepID=UPI0035117452